MSARFVRLDETARSRISITIDGGTATALEGDTVLVAVLTNVGHLRTSEFGGGPRAGFCLMGACQDCWVWTETGERVRACTTTVTAGMRLMTTAPEGLWPSFA